MTEIKFQLLAAAVKSANSKLCALKLENQVELGDSIMGLTLCSVFHWGTKLSQTCWQT